MRIRIRLHKTWHFGISVLMTQKDTACVCSDLVFADGAAISQGRWKVSDTYSPSTLQFIDYQCVWQTIWRSIRQHLRDTGNRTSSQFNRQTQYLCSGFVNLSVCLYSRQILKCGVTKFSPTTMMPWGHGVLTHRYNSKSYRIVLQWS